MKLKLFIFLFCIFYSSHLLAQAPEELTQSRILILLDGSSSMIQNWKGGGPKFNAAARLILQIMDSTYAVNKDVEFSLRVFGHQFTVDEHNCYDTKNEVAFSKDNRIQMSLRLADIHPLGITPITFALLEAARNDLADVQHYSYSIILITDGGESCGGDICEAARLMRKNKVFFKPYIVSLEQDTTLRSTYSCLGEYLEFTDGNQMVSTVNTIISAFRPNISISKRAYDNIKRANGISDEDKNKTVKINLPAIPTGLDRLPLSPVQIDSTWKYDTSGLAFREVPTVPPFRFENPIEIPTLGPVPITGESAEFILDTIPARQTTVEIYFTNKNKDKTYLSKPRTLLIDAVTGNVVRDFKREIDGLGNVETLKDIPVGLYHITFPGKKSLVVRNVPVTFRKKNKIIIVVKNSRVAFAYADAPKRPVSEFKASITERSKQLGATVTQQCSDTGRFSPGNYDVEINTFPKDNRNITLDFNEDTVLTILQPGMARFTGLEPYKKFVTLYRQDGDKYLFFYTLDIHDPESRRLRMQPGNYEVHYLKGKRESPLDELIVPFAIAGTRETVIELK